MRGGICQSRVRNPHSHLVPLDLRVHHSRAPHPMDELLSRYSAALTAMDGTALAACFDKDARYHSALTALESKLRTAASDPRPRTATLRYSARTAAMEHKPRTAALEHSSQTATMEHGVHTAEADAAEEEHSIPASALPSFFAALDRSLRERRVLVHAVMCDAATAVTVASGASPSLRRAFVEYTLSGLWSGRLSSMVVGVYDKPIRLRCIDCLTIRAGSDGSAPLVVQSRVHLDRLQFLVQIGMARAML